MATGDNDWDRNVQEAIVRQLRKVQSLIQPSKTPLPSDSVKDDVSAFIDGAYQFVETNDCVGEYLGDMFNGKPHGIGTLLMFPSREDVYKGKQKHRFGT
jgi:hypothetical protein